MKFLQKMGFATFASLLLTISASLGAHENSCSVNGVNIGYPEGVSPVPLTPECLLPQVSGTIFSGAAVEPTIAVNPKHPKHIVAAWQQGRISNGSALEIGTAHSTDGGKHWKRTTVPLQVCDGGTNQRVSDPWLSYAPDGSRVYLNALVSNRTLEGDPSKQMGIVVSTSKNNGKTWGTPIFVDRSALVRTDPDTYDNPFLDKNSITADPNRKRNAYTTWDTFPNFDSFHSDTYFSRTLNGGHSWCVPELIYNPFPDLTGTGLSNGIYNDCQTIDNIILVQPKKKCSSDPRLQGDLLCFMIRVYAKPTATDDEYGSDFFPVQFTNVDAVVIRSKDQGQTWDVTSTIVIPSTDLCNSPSPQVPLIFTGGYTYDIDGNITGGVGTQLRTGELTPIPAINPKNGNLYYVVQTGVLRPDQLPQIGLKTSRDGGYTWSTLAQVSRTPFAAANPQAFTPAVAVTEDGYVGILYFDFRNDDMSDPDNTLTDAWLAIYKEIMNPTGGTTGIGLEFVREVRLSKHSYIAQNGPATSQGVMTDGDYPFIVAVGDRFYACYTKSFDGPFTPATEIAPNLFLDTNYRTAPFVSIVDQRD